MLTLIKVTLKGLSQNVLLPHKETTHPKLIEWFVFHQIIRGENRKA